MFHLNKVAQHESENRMNAKSLAIIWGPVLFNDSSTSAQDLSYKTKVVEELMAMLQIFSNLMNNCYNITCII